jgi:choline dehydrogenase-like flavoprotein
MIIDAQSLPSNEVVETDVCIVGSGPAGLSLARELMGQNFRVCILESGGIEKPDANLEAMAAVQTKSDFMQVGLDTRYRRFGGNSSFWSINLPDKQLGLRHRPFDFIDFEQRDWIPYSGWAIDRHELMPYYERAQTACGMGRFAYEVEDWEDAEHPRLPFVGDGVTTRMFQFSPGKVFFEQGREALQQSPNITTYLHATVAELESDALSGQVKRARVVCLGGKQFWVTAKFFILAVGGIESAQLLLLSNQTKTAGLGNEHDVVGRFFMDHPLVYGGQFYPHDPQLFNRTGLYDLRQVNGTPIMGVLGLTDDVMRREKLVNISASLFPRPYLEHLEAIASVKELLFLRAFKSGQFFHHFKTVLSRMDEIAEWFYAKVTRPPQPFFCNFGTGGWSHLQPKRERAYGSFEVLHQTEQLPNPNNRVRLSDQLDPLGRRRVQMETQWRQADIEGVQRAQAVLAREIDRAGLGRFKIARDGDLPMMSTPGTAHHMGTTRMHVSPKWGVVDANCKVHSVPNLFIASGAVFPTGSYANPTLTIVALSIRLGDRIKQLMQQDGLTIATSRQEQPLVNSPH